MKDHESVNESSNGDNDTGKKDKSVDHYIETYVSKIVEGAERQASILEKFKTVKSDALDMMVKGE
jgi:hypothetical protein